MKRFLVCTLAVLFFAGLSSCAKTDPTSTSQGLSQEVINQIVALGFSPDDAYAADGGYIVENDIFLTKEDLNGQVPGVVNNVVVGNTEQYRTTNLVTGLPRTITVSSSGQVNANVNSAIDGMIARYNAENLQLHFTRVTSGGQINIKIVNGGSYIASSGFPSGGNPYSLVKFNKQYENWGIPTLTSVMAHEVGHCIGFRHTDYMDRSYSCGGATSNEGDGGVGAIFITGTSSGPEPDSWMLACTGSTTDRPFDSFDKTALNFLY